MTRPTAFRQINGFAREMLALSSELERWRTEVRLADVSSTDGLPSFERKAGLQSLVFFLVFLISAKTGSLVQSAHSLVASVSLSFALVISVSAAPILFLQAIGLTKKQFWRALWALRKTKPTSSFPFTALSGRIENDARNGRRLRQFRASVIQAVLDRINQDESEMRERLAAVIGNPTGLVLFGVMGGIFTTWESYYAHPDSLVNAALFWGSIGTLLLGAFGLRHRMALFELARCRGLLTLEIARRAYADAQHSGQRVSVKPNILS